MVEDLLSLNPGTQIVTILIGIAALILGRKLFWMATGVTGFILGLTLVSQLSGRLPDLLILVIALATGILGALAAILVQKIAIGVAGFFLGGYSAFSLLEILEYDAWAGSWLLFIVGGLIGVILALSLLEIALILLSTLAGAILIVQATDFSPLISIVFIFGPVDHGHYPSSENVAGKGLTFCHTRLKNPLHRTINLWYNFCS